MSSPHLWALGRTTGRVPLVIALVLAVSAGAGQPANAQESVGAIDCVGPAGDPEPGTPAWYERDLENQYCAEQRHLDKLTHPTNLLPANELGADVYREPSRHAGVRFRYDATVIGGLEVEIYRPCSPEDCEGTPPEVATHEPPYPAVITFHGGASRKELHWWSSQSLAEAGYLVIAYDSEGVGPTVDEAAVMMDFLHGDDPLVADFDGERVGLAGHSGGGVVVNEYGHSDPRVDAIVSWDRAQSSPLPADPTPTTPSLFLFADYNCQQVPYCQPEPYLEPPDPHGPGNKGQDFMLVRDAGVDAMQIGLRAALHLDWVPSDLAGNRFAEIVTVYYTRAWMDRYVRGLTEPDVAADAFGRMTASTFDDSADVLNMSQGTYDPAAAAAAGDPYAGNVPYTIAGLPVADRLSFYYLSKCFLTIPGTQIRATSDDIRSEGCGAPTVTDADPPRHEESTYEPSVPPPDRQLPATGDGDPALAIIALLLADRILRHGGRRRTPTAATASASDGSREKEGHLTA